MSAAVDHWFDFICPFCYVGQDRNRILRAHGIEVVDHPMQIHPEIGPGGALAGPRVGPTYDFLAAEAESAGLPLVWRDRIPFSRPALSAYVWLRKLSPEVAEDFATRIFDAYFGHGEDIEPEELLLQIATGAGADSVDLHAALSGSTADDLLAEELRSAAEHGVRGTPYWSADGQAVSGLRPRTWFESWATSLSTLSRRA
jgi:predicted DsbA family dithiol-disulfide isomerase